MKKDERRFSHDKATIIRPSCQVTNPNANVTIERENCWKRTLMVQGHPFPRLDPDPDDADPDGDAIHIRISKYQNTKKNLKKKNRTK